MKKIRSKFNVDISSKGKEKRTYKGICYDSEAEMKFYRDWIEPRLQSKEILKCDRQVKYELQSAFDCQGKHYNAINYKSDFDLTFSDGTFKVIDVKGMVKPEDKLKEKLFRHKYSNIIFEYRNFSKMDGGWILLDDILKARKQRKKLKQCKSNNIKGDK